MLGRHDAAVPGADVAVADAAVAAPAPVDHNDPALLEIPRLADEDLAAAAVADEDLAVAVAAAVAPAAVAPAAVAPAVVVAAPAANVPLTFDDIYKQINELNLTRDEAAVIFPELWDGLEELELREASDREKMIAHNQYWATRVGKVLEKPAIEDYEPIAIAIENQATQDKIAQVREERDALYAEDKEFADLEKIGFEETRRERIEKEDAGKLVPQNPYAAYQAEAGRDRTAKAVASVKITAKRTREDTSYNIKLLRIKRNPNASTGFTGFVHGFRSYITRPIHTGFHHTKYFLLDAISAIKFAAKWVGYQTGQFVGSPSTTISRMFESLGRSLKDLKNKMTLRTSYAGTWLASEAKICLISCETPVRRAFATSLHRLGETISSSTTAVFRKLADAYNDSSRREDVDILFDDNNAKLLIAECRRSGLIASEPHETPGLRGLVAGDDDVLPRLFDPDAPEPVVAPRAPALVVEPELLDADAEALNVAPASIAPSIL